MFDLKFTPGTAKNRSRMRKSTLCRRAARSVQLNVAQGMLDFGDNEATSFRYIGTVSLKSIYIYIDNNSFDSLPILFHING